MEKVNVLSCPMSEVNVEFLVGLTKKYKNIYLDRTVFNHNRVSNRMDGKFYFSRWIGGVIKNGDGNGFITNVTFNLNRIDGDYFIEITHDELPPVCTVDFHDKVSKLTPEFVCEWVTLDRFKHHTFPTLDGNTAHLFHDYDKRFVGEYLNDITRKFGDVVITLKHSTGLRGTVLNSAIEGEAYDAYIKHSREIMENCIEHDREVGYLYNE